MALRVEWKETTVASVCEGGVAFAEAATVLGDPLSWTIADSVHSFDEARFVTMGLSSRGRLLVVEHVDHGDTIWIITVRRASQKIDGRTPRSAERDFSKGIRGKYAARYWESAARGQLRRTRRGSAENAEHAPK